jgi:hypothetical protein
MVSSILLVAAPSAPYRAALPVLRQVVRKRIPMEAGLQSPKPVVCPYSSILGCPYHPIASTAWCIHACIQTRAAMLLIVCLRLCLLTFLSGVLARPSIPGPAARPHSLRRPSKRQGCSSGKEVTITAPSKNIFQGLTDHEYAQVTAYLHQQKELNLTAVVNSTS